MYHFWPFFKVATCWGRGDSMAVGSTLEPLYCTVSTTVVVCDSLPLVPVMVML